MYNMVIYIDMIQVTQFVTVMEPCPFFFTLAHLTLGAHRHYPSH